MASLCLETSIILINMTRMKNKKSQIFTLLAIVMIALLFVSFEVYSFIHERNAIKTRVTTMKTFLNSVESNLERQMFISGFRILFLAEAEITSNGSYVNVNDFFNEAFFNGTVNGEPNNTILEGTTYDDILESINIKAAKINVNVTMTNPLVEIKHVDPWNIRFTLITDFIMSDKEGLARWEKVQNISAIIPIEGFEDPLFTVGSIGKVPRLINRTVYEGQYAWTVPIDVANLTDHVNKGLYAENPDAPSFLMRLEGNLSADLNGIESFVIIPDLSSQGLPIQDKTTIDHIYFSSNVPPSNHVQNMPIWFKIDNENNRAKKYQVSSLLI